MSRWRMKANVFPLEKTVTQDWIVCVNFPVDEDGISDAYAGR